MTKGAIVGQYRTDSTWKGYFHSSADSTPGVMVPALVQRVLLQKGDLDDVVKGLAEDAPHGWHSLPRGVPIDASDANSYAYSGSIDEWCRWAYLFDLSARRLDTLEVMPALADSSNPRIETRGRIWFSPDGTVEMDRVGAVQDAISLALQRFELAPSGVADVLRGVIAKSIATRLGIPIRRDTQVKVHLPTAHESVRNLSLGPFQLAYPYPTTLDTWHVVLEERACQIRWELVSFYGGVDEVLGKQGVLETLLEAVICSSLAVRRGYADREAVVEDDRMVVYEWRVVTDALPPLPGQISVAAARRHDPAYEAGDLMAEVSVPSGWAGDLLRWLEG